MDDLYPTPNAQCAVPKPSSELFSRWALRADIAHLDHGSCGGCPLETHEAAGRWRMRLDASPPDFYMRRFHPALKTAKEAMAEYLNADPADLVLMPGSTSGLNVVAQSHRFAPGDELLITNHAYATATKILSAVAERDGATVVTAEVPFPCQGPDDVVQAILAAVSPRTRFALIDHIPSRTAVVYPIRRIIEELEARDIEVLVDGAHGPGQVRVDLKAMAPPYYVASCHKWMCTPRGVGFMYVRPDKAPRVRQVVVARTTYGRDPTPTTHTALEYNFDWQGTFDPSAFLATPDVVRFLRTVVPGGDEARIARNHALALAARRVVFHKLGLTDRRLWLPDDMVSCMVTIPLPDDPTPKVPGFLPLQAALWHRFNTEAQAYHLPKWPKRALRFSCQLHNSIEQYEYLADCIKTCLDEEEQHGRILI